MAHNYMRVVEVCHLLWLSTRRAGGDSREQATSQTLRLVIDGQCTEVHAMMSFNRAHSAQTKQLR